MATCLFCGNTHHKSSVFEDTVFNNKTFEYIKCSACGLIQVNPLPNADDLNKMYPVEYQSEVTGTNDNRYGFLFEELEKVQLPGKKLLDYGCGAGQFLVEARDRGYQAFGSEFNPDLVKQLAEKINGVQFITIEEMLKPAYSETFDIILLNNVLEHLTNPKPIMEILKSKLNPNGVFILTGPIENNFNLTQQSRKLIFSIRKNLFGKKASHTPTHIIYSNRNNQLAFFKNLGLETLVFNISEGHWPYPSSLAQCTSTMQKAMYYIANTSVKMSKKFDFWGNVFLYIGRKVD